MTVFYLASTPLNILLACSVALAQKNNRAVLLLIDQTLAEDKNPYFLALARWCKSPFARVVIISYKQKTAINQIMVKYHARKQVFSRIARLVREYQPVHLYTGNDRRIEFHYCFEQMQHHHTHCTADYIDDGLFSYLPRKARWWERYIVGAINRYCYGRWRETPNSAGHSIKITRLHVAFPALVAASLRHKPITVLPNNLNSDEIKAFSALLLKVMIESDENVNTVSHLYVQAELIIVLPHESNYGNSENYKQWLLGIVEKTEKKCLVKYHPRNREQDSLQLGQHHKIALLPSYVPFECFLPLLDNPLIIGDVSAALMTSRWLRPDLRVCACVKKPPKKMATFYRQVGIEFMTMDF